MAIKLIPYQQSGAAQLRNVPGAVKQTPMDLTNTVDAQAARQLVGEGQKLAASYAQVQQDKKESQQATDLLDEGNKLAERALQFKANYAEINKGKDAANAMQDFSDFFRDENEVASQRFAGDARQSLMWQKKFSQIRYSGMLQAQEYAEQQVNLYKKDTADALEATFYQDVASITDDAHLNDRRDMLNKDLKAIHYGRPDYIDAKMAEIDLNVAVVRIASVLSSDEPGHVDEAERLVSSYRAVLGKSLPAMEAKVRTARITEDAYDIAAQVAEEARASEIPWTLGQKTDKVRELSNGDKEVDAKARKNVIYEHNTEKNIKRDLEHQTLNHYTSQAVGVKDYNQLKMLLKHARDNIADDSLYKKTENAIMKAAEPPKFSDEDGYAKAQQYIIDGGDVENFDREFFGQLSKKDADRFKARISQKGAKRVTNYEKKFNSETLRTLYPNTKGEDKVARTTLLNKLVEWNDDFAADNGRSPTVEEMKKQEAYLLEPVIYDFDFTFHHKAARGLLSNLAPSAFDVDPVDVQLGRIPPAELAKIEVSLKKHGEAVTNAKIAKAYKDKLMRE